MSRIEYIRWCHNLLKQKFPSVDIRPPFEQLTEDDHYVFAMVATPGLFITAEALVDRNERNMRVMIFKEGRAEDYAKLENAIHEAFGSGSSALDKITSDKDPKRPRSIGLTWSRDDHSPGYPAERQKCKRLLDQMRGYLRQHATGAGFTLIDINPDDEGPASFLEELAANAKVEKAQEWFVTQIDHAVTKRALSSEEAETVADMLADLDGEVVLALRKFIVAARRNR